jgi:hypothetical protein
LATSYDGYSYYAASFAYLAKNAVRLSDIDIPGSSSSSYYRDVLGLAWDGKYWVIESYDDLYRVSIKKGVASYIGDTTLDDRYTPNGPLAFYSPTYGGSANQVAGAIYEDGNNNAVEYWKYPSGGAPYAAITHGLDYPYASVVSLKP